jgi:hypothetical protein
MRKILILMLLALFAFPLMAQKTVPGPSNGAWVLIDTTYKLGSYKAGNTDMKLYYHNSTGSKITGVQFRVFYDTVAFKTPTVTSLNTSWSQHLSYNVVGNHITVAMAYTGSSNSFTMPNGELVKVNFVHKSAFPTLTAIDSTRFAGSPVFTSLAALQTGVDTTLNKHTYNGTWEFPEFKFTGHFVNVNSKAVKKMTVALEKKVKTGTTWTQVKADTTNSLGYVTFNQIIDTTYYNTRMVVRGDTMSGNSAISIADAHKINKFVTGELTPRGFDFYTSDVNNSKGITISDVYAVFGRLSSRFSSWINSTPEVKFFTVSQYNTIVNDSTNNYTASIPGVDTIYFNINPGVDSVKYWIATPGDANGTGFKVARMIPVKIVNPNNAPNWVIDYQLHYDDPSMKEIEVRLPKLGTVEEGNLVNIPLQVKNMGEKVGSLQYGIFYDTALLKFSSILVSEKASNWLSYTNPSDNVIEWGGYDPTNSTNLIDQETEVASMQFIARKPKAEWGKSPLYVVRKSSGDEKCNDLVMSPTEGVVQIMRVVNNSPKDFDEIVCYPNPTTGLTNLEFTRKTVGYTELVILDNTGALVEYVVSEIVPTGKYRYTVDLTTRAEGFYYLVVSSDRESDATKVVLQK